MPSAYLRYFFLRAEGERFELSVPCGTPPFQGGALDHYANPPCYKKYTALDKKERRPGITRPPLNGDLDRSLGKSGVRVMPPIEAARDAQLRAGEPIDHRVLGHAVVEKLSSSLICSGSSDPLRCFSQKIYQHFCLLR